jgi:hypothetical protein
MAKRMHHHLSLSSTSITETLLQQKASDLIVKPHEGIIG